MLLTDDIEELSGPRSGSNGTLGRELIRTEQRKGYAQGSKTIFASVLAN